MDRNGNSSSQSDSETGWRRLLDPSKSGASRFVYFAAVIAALNGLLLGFDLGIISGALLYIKQTFQVSSFMQEVIVSIAVVGAVFGSAIGGTLSDWLGRRRLAILTGAVFFGSSLWMALSPTLTWLITGRFVLGLAVGVASIMGSLYISEIAPTSIRGGLVTMNQLAISGGILISAIINYAFASYFSGSGVWRWMLGFAMLPAVLLLIGGLFLPETPRWLVANNQEDEARQTLSRLRSGTDIDAEIKEIKRVIKIDEKGIRELFEPYVRPALIVGIGLAIFAQFTGTNTIIYYAPTIFTQAGFGNLAALLANLGLDIVATISVVVSLLIIDKVGRRPMLIAGLATAAFSMILVGFKFLFGLSGIIAVIGLLLFKIAFAIGISPMFRLIISEIYPLIVRGTAQSVMNVIHFVANLIVSLSFLSLLNIIGRPSTFGLYAVTSVIAILFVYFLVPETKERSLEEIELDMHRNIGDIEIAENIENQTPERGSD